MYVVYAFLGFLALRRWLERDKPIVDYSLASWRLSELPNVVAFLLMIGIPPWLADNSDSLPQNLSLVPAALFFVAIDTWRRRYLRSLSAAARAVAAAS